VNFGYKGQPPAAAAAPEGPNGDEMRADLRYLAIAMAAMSAFLNLYSPQAVLPLLVQDFGATAGQVSLTMTATTLAVALVAPFTGAIADVLGRKRVITGAMFGIVVPTVLAAYAPTLDALIVWRFVQGLMLPPIFAITIAYIGEEWPPAEATRMTGIYTACASFGGFLGRFVTGAVAEWYGWRIAVLTDGALTLIFAIGVIALLPREKHFVRASSLRAAMAQMLHHLRNPQLVGTYAVGFGVLFCFIASFTYVSFVLAARPYNLSPGLLGSIFVVYLFGTTLTPLTGRLVARFGRRHFVLAVIAVWLCGLGLMLLPSLWAIIAGLSLFAACGFFCQAASTSYVALSAHGGTSSAVGLYVTSFYIGGSVGAVVGGIAWSFGEWPAVVATIAGMQIVMATLIATVWPNTR
jgi:predicted MFS family arabinose efflux permease